MEIIDFHTHPYLGDESNICNHKAQVSMPTEAAKDYLQSMGISKICGSVISLGVPETGVEKMLLDNNKALELRERYGDFYIPGFHVDPNFVKESLLEVERMHGLGVNLIGELVPYIYGWENYATKELSEILDLAEDYGMVVSIHSMDDDDMDKLVREHKNLTIIAAHPNERREYERHLDRMKMSENYYLDLSGTGLFRHAMLRRGIDQCGVERFIFGSDFPTCNPAMFIGGVMLDPLITDEEKEAIFSKNIKRLLKI